MNSLRHVYIVAGITSLFLGYCIGLLTANWWVSVPSVVIGLTNLFVGVLGDRITKI